MYVHMNQYTNDTFIMVGNGLHHLTLAVKGNKYGTMMEKWTPQFMHWLLCKINS